MAKPQSRPGGSRQYSSETVWKLVSASCEQLAEAARSARVPIVLLLTWTLVWFMVIYEIQFGTFKNLQAPQLRRAWAGDILLKQAVERRLQVAVRPGELAGAPARAAARCGAAATGSPPSAPAVELKVQQLVECAENLLARAATRDEGAALRAHLDRQLASIGEQDVPANARWAFFICAQRFELKAGARLTRDQVLACSARSEKGLDALTGTLLEAHFVALPLGIGKTSVNDLAIVGSLAMLLLLTWTTLAMRAENRAVRGFVDFAARSPLRLRTVVEVVPQNRAWQAEHLAFAYHSVRARFFNFVPRPEPDGGIRLLRLWDSLFGLRLWTSLVLCAPLAVTSWQLVSDWYWLLDNQDTAAYAGLIGSIRKRTEVQTLLFVPLFMLWWMTLRAVLDTSDLLSAWSIATEEVWGSRWNEARDERPEIVRVDLWQGTAVGRRAWLPEPPWFGRDDDHPSPPAPRRPRWRFSGAPGAGAALAARRRRRPAVAD